MNINLFSLAQRSPEEIKIIFSVSGFDPENWLRTTLDGLKLDRSRAEKVSAEYGDPGAKSGTGQLLNKIAHEIEAISTIAGKLGIDLTKQNRLPHPISKAAMRRMYARINKKEAKPV